MKANMAGQDVSLSNKLRGAAQTWRLYRSNFFANAESEVQAYREIVDAFSARSNLPWAGARVLDLGCGQTAHIAAMALADGADVAAIDVEVPTLSLGPAKLMKVWRANGFERALKSFVRHNLFDRRFVAALSREFGRPLPFEAVEARFRLMSATAMAFPDNSFDFVYSRNVFEHIDDVPAALREVNRVLKPGGLARIALHLFTSLTGGHHMEWLVGGVDEQRTVPPWDHLRENRFPANFYLNRHRLHDYRSFFANHMTVLSEERRPERIHPMTPAIEEELRSKGYAPEEWETRELRFLCAKKQR